VIGLFQINIDIDYALYLEILIEIVM